MRQFYKKKSFRILIVILVILGLILAHTAWRGSVIFSNLFGIVTTPMQKVSASVADGVISAAEEAAMSKEELVEENRALKEEINTLNEQLSDYYDYKQENEQLKKFLDLKQDNPDYSFVYGSVVARDSSDLFYSFRVDKGSTDGVAVHDPVVTESGLVGWVSSVSAVYCNVTTILSPDTSISALDKVSRDSGVVGCDISLSERGLVRLSYLDKTNTVSKGDMVVTSGIGGYFPKNLRIGKAVKVKNSETDVSLYAEIKPYADIKNAKEVLIITEFAGQGEALPEATVPAAAGGQTAAETESGT